MSITWNGVSSDTIGVIVERIPNRYVPTRRFSPQQVAGRNGNILLVDKSFPNVEQEYEVYLSAEAQGLPSVARACAEWLMGPDGYCRLQDSYDTTVYREAFLMGGYDLENILNKFGRCTITFSCKPQKYLITGDTPIEIPAGITTYTGDAVQFDGVTGASITSLSTTITPTQDLHGYANPWPAGGGKNKWEFASEYSGSGSLASNLRFTNRIAAGTYVLSCKGTFASGGAVQFRFVYTDSTTTDVSLGYNKSGNTYYKSVVFDSDVRAVSYIYSNNAGNSITDIQLEPGSTFSDYAPYSNICPISGRTGLSVYVGPTQDQQDATTYAVDWTSEAGTVYGGTLDVVSGLLTVTMAEVTLKGTESFTLYNASGNNPRRFMRSASALGIATPADNDERDISTHFKCQKTATKTEAFGTFRISSYLTFPDANSEFADATAFNNWLATQNTNGTPVKIEYILATPITYQLTAQDVGVLVGKNNVWTSSGPVSVTVVAPFVGTVTNPTPFEARPMLEVSGVGEITINGKSIQILESVSDFQIDCEAMEAEDNSKIYCMDFPELSGGENEIVGDGSITALTVTPRWWTL